MKSTAQPHQLQRPHSAAPTHIIEPLSRLPPKLPLVHQLLQHRYLGDQLLRDLTALRLFAPAVGDKGCSVCQERVSVMRGKDVAGLTESNEVEEFEWL